MATDTDNTGEPQELRKAYDTAMAELKQIKSQYRNLLATTTFEKAKLNPKHAELFLKVNGDEPITPEGAMKFAEEYGLAVQEPAPPAEVAGTPPPPANVGLSTMSGAGSQAGGAGNTALTGPKMTQAEFQKLYASDQAAATKAYAEGRVERAPGNVIADEAVKKGLIAG